MLTLSIIYNQAKQNSRKLGVFDRKSEESHSILIDILIHIRNNEAIMSNQYFIELLNELGIRIIVYNLRVINQEATSKTDMVPPPRPGPYKNLLHYVNDSHPKAPV